LQESDFANRVSGLTLRHAALIAGITYLLNPVTFAEAYAMPRLVVADANQTVANIAAHPHLFSAAVLSYFFSLLGDVVFAWTFYVLLAPVNRALSLLASWLQLTYAAVSLAAVSNLSLLYRLLVIPGYSRHVSASSLPEQRILLLGSFRSGWGLGLILWRSHSLQACRHCRRVSGSLSYPGHPHERLRRKQVHLHELFWPRPEHLISQGHDDGDRLRRSNRNSDLKQSLVISVPVR